MQEYTYGNAEAAALGYNRKWVIDYTDISAAAASKTLTLADYAEGDRMSGFWHDIVTNFDGGATSELTIKVGHNGTSVDDDDSQIAATSVHADATYINHAKGAGASAAGYAARDAGNLEIIFTATGANTSVLTQGKIVITGTLLPYSQVLAR